uniref:Uncharacterized protein n=1 Tax=Glossina brevipalpis TaxID=37001 RepID=A0A1A9WQ83_9MUSC
MKDKQNKRSNVIVATVSADTEGLIFLGVFIQLVIFQSSFTYHYHITKLKYHLGCNNSSIYQANSFKCLLSCVPLLVIMLGYNVMVLLRASDRLWLNAKYSNPYRFLRLLVPKYTCSTALNVPDIALLFPPPAKFGICIKSSSYSLYYFTMPEEGIG